ncbi:MAG: hypothetical protein CVU14_01430 [Bacteroidetes bacterium HGW-Bacteroidetes-9]|jgi:membrane protein required for colicin V production|nr:MAG: hypothetical protein CVU14_01430 [Bacteroidetes bacterium HGW-Bacteroidetes-9]
MVFIDIVIVVIALIAAIKGFMKGLIIGIASLAGLILGIVFSLRYAGDLAEIFQSMFGSNSRYLYFAAYLVCFLFIVMIVHLIGKSIEKVIEIAALGFLNKIAGAAFGILKVLFVFSAIFYLMKIVDPQSHLVKPETKQKSLFYQPLEWLLPSTLPFLKNQLEKINFDKANQKDIDQ